MLNFIKQNYTERRKTERKKENVSPLHHRPTTERRNIKRKKREKYEMRGREADSDKREKKEIQRAEHEER